MGFNLYPFQDEDVRKLVRQQNASIESEMAAGKTHEAIALDELWNPLREKPTLIIAPINTWDTWRDKFGMQSPGLDVTVIDRKNRDKFVDLIRRKWGHIFVMHWEAVALIPELQKMYFEFIVCDEAHRLANDTRQTRAVKALGSNRKLAMSGTMAGETPDKLWGAYNWLWPTYFTSYWRFRRRYCIEDKVWSERSQSFYKIIVGTQRIDELDAIREPWRVRHLKREQCCPNHPNGIMPWLPDKTYDVIKVDLNPTQRRIYNQMRDQMVAWLGEHENEPLAAQEAIVRLTRLSQMAIATPEFYKAWEWQSKIDEQTGNEIIDPVTGKAEKERVEVDKIRLTPPSSKIEAVRNYILDRMHQQFVVYSASKQACYLAQEDFVKHGISACVLSGDTPQSERDGMVKRFANGDFQVFIGVIEAAGEGIDGLQETCDTMIFMDRSWRVIKNKQAEERLDRPGQKNATHVIDIVARNTVDGERRTKLDLKWQHIKEILGDK